MRVKKLGIRTMPTAPIRQNKPPATMQAQLIASAIALTG
jgi:hypothetical protein